MKHYASPGFWAYLEDLPESIQQRAREKFELLKENPRHPSLRLKKVGAFWSARVDRSSRALGKSVEDGILWGWIGTHAEYDELI